jgi:hypothetical protein
LTTKESFNDSLIVAPPAKVHFLFVLRARKETTVSQKQGQFGQCSVRLGQHKRIAMRLLTVMDSKSIGVSQAVKIFNIERSFEKPNDPDPFGSTD